MIYKKNVLKLFLIQLFSSANVVIKVQNINEFAPDFVGLPYDFRAEENAARGTKIGHVKAFDGDGDKVKYSLSGGDTGNELCMFTNYIISALRFYKISRLLIISITHRIYKHCH